MSITDYIYRIKSYSDKFFLPWQNNREKKYELKSLGTLIKLNSKIFFVTTYHSINYGDKTENIMIDDDDVEYLLGDPTYVSPEIDIAFFEIKKKCSDDIFEINNMNDMNIDINAIKNDTDFDFIIPFNDNYMSLQCNILKFSKKKYNNCCYPEMPMFTGKLTDISLAKIEGDLYKLKGASGTPIYKDDKLFGFLSGICFKDGTLIITPIFLVKRILNEINSTNLFNGLCKIYFDTDIIDENTLIQNIYNVDYNKYNKLYNVKNSRLRKNDIIISIDGIKVIKGMIFDKNINIFVDIDTYFIINKDINHINDILVFRPNNEKNKYVNITIGNRDIYSCINFDLVSKKTIFFNIENEYYCEVNANLFNLLLEYRDYKEDDSVYTELKIKYSDNKANEKKVLLCYNINYEYSIFNNKKIKCYSYDNLTDDFSVLDKIKLHTDFLKMKVS